MGTECRQRDRLVGPPPDKISCSVWSSAARCCSSDVIPEVRVPVSEPILMAIEAGGCRRMSVVSSARHGL